MTAPFRPIAERLSELPLLICGPIVRRVDAGQLSVFAVTRRPCRIRLTLHEESSPGSPVRLTAEAETLPLGTNLHPAVVTARFEPGTLHPGRSYGYDLAFETLDGSLPPNDLAGLGLLDGPFPLGYRPGILPTLVLPPENTENLRFFHGSCRKPHGIGLDGLAPLDTVQCSAATGDGEKRPHQLYLTGDQIYADDVAGPLLQMILDAGETLLGRHESPPAGMDGWPESLAPGARRKLVLDPGPAALSTDVADNHLVRFSEYTAMYLLVWSPVLWPCESDLERLLGPPPGKEREPLLEATARTDEHRLWQFHATLPHVRRALANIPTYMIFDDHDVTDDWNLNGEWCERVYGRRERYPLAPRIVQNALAAYTVFQAWGNDPDQFSGDRRGARALEILARWEGRSDEDARLHSLLRVDPRLPVEEGIDWHYAIRFPSHRLVVLDTRTCRRFHEEGEAGAELIAEEHLGRQLAEPLERDDPDPPVTVVVSPGPVFGIRLVEDLQRLAVSRFVRHAPVFKALRTACEMVDAEAWKLHEEAFQNLIRSLGRGERVVLLSGDVHYGFTKRCELFDEVSGHRSVIAQLTASSFKNESPGLWLLHQWGAVLQGPEPEYYHGWDTSEGELTLRDGSKEPQLGQEYRTSDPVPALLARRLFKTRNTVVFESTSGTWKPDPPSQWKYQLLTQGRPVSFRHAVAEIFRSYAASVSKGIRRAPGRPRALLRALRPSQALWNTPYAGKTLIGVSCIGDISFTKDPLFVRHRLWWRRRDGKVGAYTEHDISLLPAGEWPPPEE